MKIHNIEQGTPEWFEVRKLKMTASNAQAIGNNGKGLEAYIYQLLAESLSSAPKESYTNEHIERGKELEAQARSLYELENDVVIEEVGFIELSEYVGCSPDGLIGKEGGIEIKCVNDVKHLKTLLNGTKEIDSAYIWQIQMSLLITNRKWWDYVQYNPNFESSLFIYKIVPDETMQEKLKAGLKFGEARIKELQAKLKLIKTK
jgi:putative phage-type endonuclease